MDVRSAAKLRDRARGAGGQAAPRHRRHDRGRPEADTGGGTSDARFIAPSARLRIRAGRPTMHQVNVMRTGDGATRPGRHLSRRPDRDSCRERRGRRAGDDAAGARTKKAGLLLFGATREAFLASLAPLIAFPLVGGALMVLGGGGLEAFTDLLATLCALLAPPVLSFEVARFWGRRDRGCASRPHSIGVGG